VKSLNKEENIYWRGSTRHSVVPREHRDWGEEVPRTETVLFQFYDVFRVAESVRTDLGALHWAHNSNKASQTAKPLEGLALEGVMVMYSYLEGAQTTHNIPSLGSQKVCFRPVLAGLRQALCVRK
jgi:hypothetical protein